MFTTKIAGAAAALALLAAPSVAAAHDGHHHEGHHHKHHAKKAKVREVAAGTPTATVTSFAGGVLTLTTTSGKAFAATVGPKTAVHCVTAAPQTTATTASHGGGGDDSGPGNASDRRDDDGANHDANDDNGQDAVDGNGACDTTALVAGAKVAYARLSLRDGDATWKKVVILK